MSLTSAPALEASRSDSREPGSAQSLSARSTSDASKSSSSGGQVSRYMQTSVIAMGFPCQDLSVAGKRAGLNGSQSSLLFAILGLLPRTSFTLGADGCPNCGAVSGDSGMPLCAFDCEPQKLALGTIEPAHSLLPTPTASAYGSCRGGGAGRVGKWRKSLQGLGIRHPEDWERMMGFPIGHTDVSSSATPSVHLLPKSSPAEFEK